MQPKLIALHGPSGAGKSTITELLRFKIQPSVVLGADRLRFHITDFKGEKKKEYFDLTRDIMMGMVADYLDRGFNVIIDDQLKKQHVLQLKEIALNKKASFFSYEIYAPRDIIMDRLTSREATTDYRKPNQDFLDWQYNDYEENKFADSVRFDTTTISAEEILESILREF